jgi:hypothetical protein
MTSIKNGEVSPIDPNQDVFEFEQKAYSKVSLSARLQDIKLIGSSYFVRPEIFVVSTDLEKMDLRFSGECEHYSFDEDEGICFGHFLWTALIKSGRKSCLKLKAEYLLLYSNLEGCDANHVNFFFKKVGRFATYPYFRSHFSHHTSETGIAMPPLPVLQERVD